MIQLLATHGAVLTDFQEKLVLAVVGAGALGAVATAVLKNISDIANRRRDTYSSSVETLIAWSEFAYRIRRRTSDSADELSRLANLGHELQERLAYYETWIRAESTPTGRLYGRTLSAISKKCSGSAQDAWNSPPITDAAGMNLGTWGPGRCMDLVGPLQLAIASRFGAQRLLGPLSPALLRALWKARSLK
jgi:hypothetical protein